MRTIGDGVQQHIKTAVHKELIKRIDLDKLGDMQETPGAQQQLFAVIQQIINEQGVPLSSSERDRLAQEVVDEVFGLGPLEPLLKDDTISDILVNTCNFIYVERRGVAGEDHPHLPGQQASSAHHRQNRLRGRATRRRVLADGGCASA